MEQDYIKIVFLYSRLMNIYGDRGNIICLQQRAWWRGKRVEVLEYNIGDRNFDFGDIDLFFFGGGQDLQQLAVADDLKVVGKKIVGQLEQKKAALLAICGGLQLMGEYYQTADGEKIPGLGFLSAYTVAGKKRHIGNVVVDSEVFGKIVGFENHSGQTYVDWKKNMPLGKVVVGAGNNGEDGFEGIIHLNTISSYLHGSLLPKNPKVADWLLLKAFERRYGNYQLAELDDNLEKEAAARAEVIAAKVSRVTNVSS